MTEPSHLDEALTATVREADRFNNFTDAELVRWVAREGSPVAAATIRRFLDAAAELGRLSPSRAKVEHQFADAFLVETCAKAAERIQSVMPVHRLPAERRHERPDIGAPWLFALWIGSAVFGWFAQPVWLLVPPLVITVALVQGHRRTFADFPFRDPELRQQQAAKFYGMMVAPTLLATIRNAALNTAVFATAYWTRVTFF